MSDDRHTDLLIRFAEACGGTRGYQIVLKYADTPELQQRCLLFVREAADMRFAYTKALYETYVGPDLGAWVEEDEREPALVG